MTTIITAATITATYQAELTADETPTFRIEGQPARSVAIANLLGYDAEGARVAGSTDRIGDMNLVSSKSASDEDDDVHYPVIDLDVPAALVPSSTAGHSHLYLGVGMSWEKLGALLDALVSAGVVEAGYAQACKEKHGCAYVRLPWVHKAPSDGPGATR